MTSNISLCLPEFPLYYAVFIPTCQYPMFVDFMEIHSLFFLRTNTHLLHFKVDQIKIYVVDGVSSNTVARLIDEMRIIIDIDICPDIEEERVLNPFSTGLDMFDYIWSNIYVGHIFDAYYDYCDSIALEHDIEYVLNNFIPIVIIYILCKLIWNELSRWYHKKY